MTRGELRTLVQFWLDSVDDTLYFTTAQLNMLINNAQRELQKKLLQAGEDFYTVCITASTVANQSEYALPEDYIKLFRLERLLPGSVNPGQSYYQRLYPLTRNEQDNVVYYNNGAPYNYIINKDTFTLIPTPDQVYTLHMWYAPHVEDMTDDADTPNAPPIYHEYIAILAARDGFLRDGRTLAPIESKLLYYEKLMDETSERRNEDSPRMVVSAGGGYGEWGW